jgi:hypothetical protein
MGQVLEFFGQVTTKRLFSFVNMGALTYRLIGALPFDGLPDESNGIPLSFQVFMEILLIVVIKKRDEVHAISTRGRC